MILKLCLLNKVAVLFCCDVQRHSFGIGHFLTGYVIRAPNPPNNESVEEILTVPEPGPYSS